MSKFLQYACGDSAVPDWEQLTDRDQVVGYMQKLDRSIKLVLQQACFVAGYV